MTEIATQELARARAAQIRAGIQNYLSTLANVAAAYQQRDWKALGYPSWDAYVDGEYGADRLRLSPEHRQKAVAELRLAGMSQRAIASAVGVSQETVRRDLSGDTSESPDEIQGADGKTYASTRPTNSPSGPTASSVSATDQDRTGPTTAVEAQFGAPADGADDSGTALESHPVTGESPAVDGAAPARPGPVEGSPGPGRVTPEANTRGPVLVSLNVQGFGESATETVEIDRDEWRRMHPAERIQLVEDMAETHATNHIGWGWHIADPADYANTEDGAQS